MSGDWTATYFVPISQVHPNSVGGQTGHVHLIRATDPGHHAVLPGLRKPRGRGDALCDPRRRPWMTRPPRPGEPRCPRCVAYADRQGIDWPLTTPGSA